MSIELAALFLGNLITIFGGVQMYSASSAYKKKSDRETDYITFIEGLKKTDLWKKYHHGKALLAIGILISLWGAFNASSGA